MHRRYPMLVALSLVAVALGVWDGVRVMHASGLPFTVEAVSTRTVSIHRLHDVPFPQGLEDGEIVELHAQSFATRSAILASLSESEIGPDVHLTLNVNRDGRKTQVPFTTRRLDAVPELQLAYYLGVLWAALICLTALITLWRGKDWSAWGISLWAIAFEGGMALTAAPLSGLALFATALASPLLFLLARVGFYVMAETTAGTALTARSRGRLRWSFVAFVIVGLAYELAAPLLFVFNALIVPQLIATIWALPYLLATFMLLFGYRQADAAWRQRLRWMFWSALVFTVGIQFSNVPLLGYPTSFVVEISGYVVSMTGLLYAVLRHRVVDIGFVVNRALVYSSTLTVVIAIFMLLESFVEKATLPHNASLVFELGVPLAVGFSLEAVRKRLEKLSEWLFFRRKFKADEALRNFAHHCSYVEHPDRLLEQTLHELTTHTDAPAAAVYWREDEGYRRLDQQGTPAYAERTDLDDRAIVALRADREEIDLEDYDSDIGKEGLLLPMIVRGDLLGAVALAHRPGEHFAPDERELLAHVVHEVGAALHALHARENARLVSAIAGGEIAPEAAMERARALAEPT